jgi:DNA-directed RNA polymerase specialized sigma24 family protein
MKKLLERLKRGGPDQVRELDLPEVAAPQRPELLLRLDEVLERLAAQSPECAELVKLRFFAGFTNADAAALLNISPRKADQLWAYARAWLREELDHDAGPS